MRSGWCCRLSTVETRERKKAFNWTGVSQSPVYVGYEYVCISTVICTRRAKGTCDDARRKDGSNAKTSKCVPYSFANSDKLV